MARVTNEEVLSLDVHSSSVTKLKTHRTELDKNTLIIVEHGIWNTFRMHQLNHGSRRTLVSFSCFEFQGLFSSQRSQGHPDGPFKNLDNTYSSKSSVAAINFILRKRTNRQRSTTVVSNHP